MNKDVQVFLQLQPRDLLEFFLLFTINVLNGQEPLPKQAAADFWVCPPSLSHEDNPLSSWQLGITG